MPLIKNIPLFSENQPTENLPLLSISTAGGKLRIFYIVSLAHPFNAGFVTVVFQLFILLITN